MKLILSLLIVGTLSACCVSSGNATATQPNSVAISGSASLTIGK